MALVEIGRTGPTRLSPYLPITERPLGMLADMAQAMITIVS